MVRNFLEPLRWDNIPAFKAKLGDNAANLLTYCIESEEFWNQLKESHNILIKKYPLNIRPDRILDKEINQVEVLIEKTYKRLVNIPLPRDLEDLWDRGSLLTYTSEEGKKLRESNSVEENAQFLVRWAKEVFNNWNTWLNFVLPDCKANYKSSTLRITNQIKEMISDKEITSSKEGWKKISDMLRAQVVCTSASKIMNVLAVLSKNSRVKIMRLLPKFGVKHKNLN